MIIILAWSQIPINFILFLSGLKSIQRSVR